MDAKECTRHDRRLSPMRLRGEIFRCLLVLNSNVRSGVHVDTGKHAREALVNFANGLVRRPSIPLWLLHWKNGVPICQSAQ